MAAAELALQVGVKPSCIALGVARATLYRRERLDYSLMSPYTVRVFEPAVVDQGAHACTLRARGRIHHALHGVAHPQGFVTRSYRLRDERQRIAVLRRSLVVPGPCLKLFGSGDRR